MLQSIEKRREEKPCEAVVTVMCHDRTRVLRGNSSFVAREDAALSLSGVRAVIDDVVSYASSQPWFLTLLLQLHLSRDRTRSRSLSHTEKFSADEPVARSALAVSAVSPNTRSQQAAATVITSKTEQRRCAAA